MKLTIDDLPMAKASFLRAHGYIGPETKTTLIRFGRVPGRRDGKASPVRGNVVAVHLPAVPWAGAPASSARWRSVVWSVCQDERSDLSFPVGAHREAPYGHSAAPPRPAE